MKSTRDGNCRRRCRNRRVLVIPSLSLMAMFSPAKVIAASVCICACRSVCGGHQDHRQQESICSAQSFLLGRRRLVPVKRCINTETTDRRSEHYDCSRRAGRATCRILTRQHLAHATVSEVIQEEYCTGVTCRNKPWRSLTLKLLSCFWSGNMNLSSALKTNEHWQLRLGNGDKLYWTNLSRGVFLSLQVDCFGLERELNSKNTDE